MRNAIVLFSLCPEESKDPSSQLSHKSFSVKRLKKGEREKERRERKGENQRLCLIGFFTKRLKKK